MASAWLLGLFGAFSAFLVGAVFRASLNVPVSHDEAWWLQVAKRVAASERLYSQVFCGVGPLPVWILTLGIRITRCHIATSRAITALQSVAILWAGSFVLDGIDAHLAVHAWYWVTCIAFASPLWAMDSHYSALTMFALQLGTGALIRGILQQSWVWTALLGVSLAIAVSSKYSLALPSCVLSPVALLVSREDTLLSLGVLAAGGFLVMTAAWGPIIVKNDLAQFISTAVLNKPTYISTGRITLRTAAHALRSDPDQPIQNVQVRRSMFFRRVSCLAVPAAGLSSAVALLLLVTESLDGAGRSFLVLPVSGLIAGVSALWATYPRSDDHHVRASIPLSTMSVSMTAIACGRLAEMQWYLWIAPLAVGTMMAAAAAWFVWTSVLRGDPGDVFLRSIPCFGRFPVGWYSAGSNPGNATHLTVSTGGSVLILRPDAAIWYLGSGLRNPTKYDFPYASTFGPKGQQRVIEAIRAGEVPWVCIDPVSFISAPRPEPLCRFVLDEMVFESHVEAGQLYKWTPKTTADQ
jgi:hypothetical protein